MLRVLVVSLLLMLGVSQMAFAKGIETPKKVSETVWVMGTPSQEDIQHFAENDGDVVISLLSVAEMKGSEETAWTTASGLAFYHVPINGAEGVTFAKARALDKLLLRHADKTILVHCASSNRVGALFALRAGWLDGHSVEDALAIGRLHGLTSLQDKVSKMLSE